MVKHYKAFLSFLFLLFSINKGHAQEGTDFWFAPPDVTDSHNCCTFPLYLQLTSAGQESVVTVSMPANGAFTPINVTVAAGQSQRVTLTASRTILETAPTNSVLATGLRITASTPITAYYEVGNSNNNEIFALKGANALGTEFYVPMHKHTPFYNHNTYSAPNLAYASFDIVASQNATTVSIYSPVALDGHPALTQFNITLNQGQTYSGAWTGANYASPSTHPSGAVVLSDKPIAITIKDDSDHDPAGGCYDLTGDQIVPVNILGTDYIAVRGSLGVPSPSSNNGDESILITATENNTKVYLNGSSAPVRTLFAGESYLADIDTVGSLTTNAMYVNTSKPAYATHYTGFGCELGSALLPPLNCAGSSEVSFVRSTGEGFFLTLLVRATAVNSFTITGPGTAAITTTSFQLVPGTGAATGGQWMAARLGGASGTGFTTTEIPVDQTFKVSNSSDVFALGIINGGSSTGCRYGYFSEFLAPIYVDAGSYPTLCANDTLQLNGSVTGGALQGIWSTAGSGIFLPADTVLNAKYVPSALDAANGSVQLTLVSNSICNPVSDNVTINFTPAPLIYAGSDLVACTNSPTVSLNASVSISTGGLWSNGGGTYSAGATALTGNIYTPNAAELTQDSAVLILTSTGNGICNAVTDQLVIRYTPSPSVYAGPDQFVCRNNPNVSLSGAVTVATGGTWSGGLGSYNPSNNSLTPIYTPDASEIAAGTLKLVLTSTGNGGCLAVRDTITITFTNPPTANAGSDQTVCSGNSVPLNGAVTIAGGGFWSNGLGVFSPNNNTLNASYVPTSAEIAAGFLNLILTTSGNGNCNAVKDTVKTTFKSDVAAFNYTSGTHCVSGSDPIPNITGDPGTFGATPSGLAFISASTGQIDVSSSAVKSYTVTLTTGGSCPVSATQPISIINTPDASHSYSAIPYCGSDPNPYPSFPSGSSAGVFSSVPAGLVFVSTATGQLNLTASAPGTYTITNFIAASGGCVSDTKTSAATIQQAATADAGVNQVVCVGAVVNLSGQTGGSATSSTWTGGSGIFSNASSLNSTYTPATGETNVTLTLTTNDPAGTCNPASDVMTITINADDPAFSYPSGTFCQTGTDPYPNISGGYTGTFTANSGSFVFVSPASGQVDVSATAVGTYSVTFTTNGSCPASSKQIVTIINTAPDASFSFNGPFCQGAANPFPLFPGGASAGVFSATPAGLTFVNTSSGEIDLGASSQGTYQVTNYIAASGTCSSDTKIVNVTIDPKALVDAGADQSACNSGAVNMAGFIGGSASAATWSGGTGAFLPNNTTLNAQYTPGTGETYITLTLTTNDPAGVCNAVADSMRVTVSDVPAAPTALDKSICPGDSATLVATAPGGLYQWYNSPVGGSLLKTSSAYVTPPLSSPSTYYVQTTIDGCASPRTPVAVSVVSAAIVDAGPGSSACKNNPNIQLAGTVSTGSGQWSSLGSGTFTPGNTTLNATYIPGASDLSSGAVKVVLTSQNDGSCLAATDTATLVFTNTPVPQFSYTGKCAGEQVQFIDSSYVTGSTIVSWNWNFGDASIDIVKNPAHSYSSAGTYNVKLVVESGCKDSVVNPITINPKPVAGFSVTATSFLIADLVVFTDASSSDVSGWLWDFGDSTGTASLQAASHIYGEAGFYPVTQIVTNSGGCSDTAGINITVISANNGVYPPKVPSGFSPNDDGDNDLLRVRGGPFKSLHFRIYNTWGELIFETTDVNGGWDGKWKDIKQSIGSYVYTVEGVTVDDKTYIKSGNVKLIE